jgi:superfamily II DNA or RNA helicase
MNKVLVRVLNDVYCQTNKEGRKLLAPPLIFQKKFWKQTQYRKIETTYNACLIDSSGFFLTGFLPRIKEYCKKKGYELILTGSTTIPPKRNTKSFNAFLAKVKKNLGKEYRSDQLKVQIGFINSAIDYQRGVLLSPTGTGKTTLALGIASNFPKEKVLYMCHTKTLVTQTAKEFEKYGFNVTRVMEGSKDQSGTIVVATRQSLMNMKLEKYGIVMIDEVHHMPDEDCSYGKLLKKINTPLRYGFTATLREKNQQATLAIEGHIGNIVGELTMKKAQKMEILAKPQIRIIRVPKQFLESRKYEDVYDEAVVFSRVRNRLIAKAAYDYTNTGKIVMLFVTRLAHGKEIQRIISSLYKMDVPIIQGETNSEIREDVKQGLFNKTSMILVDFFDDSSSYLIKHFGNRISLYCEKNWL